MMNLKDIENGPVKDSRGTLCGPGCSGRCEKENGVGCLLRDIIRYYGEDSCGERVVYVLSPDSTVFFKRKLSKEGRNDI